MLLELEESKNRLDELKENIKEVRGSLWRRWINKES